MQAEVKCVEALGQEPTSAKPLKASFTHPYDVDVDSDLAANSSSESDSLISPKLSNILKLGEQTEAFLNLGYGFHSNDARGMTIAVDPSSGEAVDAVPALVRSKGVDLGFSTSAIANLTTAFTMFALDSDSELVFVGDGGGTEAGRASLRKGIEWTNFYQFNDKLALELDATFTRPRFKGHGAEGDYIPGSVETTIAGGISFAKLANYYGALRVRHFGSGPLIEDNSIRSDPSTLLNGRLGYVFSNGLDLALEVFNLTDIDANDIQYFYGSRMANEAEEVEGLHVHPMEPRSARMTIKWNY